MTSTPTASTDGHQSVFRAFQREEFVEWPAWHRLAEILRTNGGSFGISGPRGSGKSWLMLRAIDDVGRADPDKGIGLWYPTPSEYKPRAFLASLTEGLANEIERRLVPPRSWLDQVVGSRFVQFTVLALLALNAVWLLAGSKHAWTSSIALIAITGALFLALYARVVRIVVQSRRPAVQLVREARRAREQARYSSTQRESAEIGAEAGHGVVGRIRSSRERELVERPATLSSLVNDFRALARHAGEVAGPVVIAIDELDKMEDPKLVRDLLRDIKGIFEVPKVHFLVSVSDEAARSLNLGALTGRDEFNSSFYTVIELPPAPPRTCAELLAQRGGIPFDVELTLGILSGGNPREVLRLAELAGRSESSGEAVVRALRPEALNLRRDIVTAEGLPEVGQESRIGSFQSLPDSALESISEFVGLAAGALGPDLWTPSWRDEGWDRRFSEPWRRLMVRLAVANRIVEGSILTRDDVFLGFLQNVVGATSQSASVARIILEQELRIDYGSSSEAPVTA